jgi:hypothetical protein
MPFVIRCVGLATNPWQGPRGQFLMTYHPSGFSEWTSDVQRAMTFESHGAAIALYRSTHPTQPTREDGRPNRPLTAFTVEVVEKAQLT